MPYKRCRGAISKFFIYVIVTTAAAWVISDEVRSQDVQDWQGLNAEQSAFANELLGFIEAMEGKYFARIGRLNRGLQLETKSFSYEHADYDVLVTRGRVVEKAGTLLANTKKPRESYQTETYWSRFYSLDIHPKTPLIGMLHATVMMQFNKDGGSSMGGWLDVMPGTRVEEDIAALTQTMDDMFSKFGKDSKRNRELSCEGDPMEFDQSFRRQPACAGASFYGNPMMTVTRENFDFMTQSFDKFIGAYIDTIEKRQNDAFTEEDVANQDRMRRRWLEDQLYADPFASDLSGANGQAA